MNVRDALKFQCLSNSKLIAGKDNLLSEITGINILEALDIENWGKSGEIILTSFFALQNLEHNELEDFFKKLNLIGISAMIIKIERLVQRIPDNIICLCNKYSIPLIQINNKVKYESIVLGILGPIINTNMSLLNKYYEIHSDLTSLAMKMPSMDEILLELKKMIIHDVSLINTTNGDEISTNPLLSNVSIIKRSNIINAKYMKFNYERLNVIYKDLNISGNQLKVTVPYLGFNNYELIIHEEEDKISSEDFMVIENAVKFLQMELLKKYAVSKNLALHKNNITSDLLNNRFHDKKDFDEVLKSLEIHKENFYRIVIIKLYKYYQSQSSDNSLMSQIIEQIKNKVKSKYKNIAFLERSDRIVYIFNYDNKTNRFDINPIEKLINNIINNSIFKNLYYCISISTEVEKYDIPKANTESLDTQKILRLFHKSNKILFYEDLGIYRLFLESNNLDNIEKFISPKIIEFKKEFPQLFETLEIFLDTNQNYKLTSEILFLHPKSVRYRIDKIKEILGIEFTNCEDILQIQVASRLFKLIQSEVTND